MTPEIGRKRQIGPPITPGGEQCIPHQTKPITKIRL